MRRCQTVLVGLLMALVSAGAFAQTAPSPRAEWMYQAKFGVFTHYLAGLQNPVADVASWNKTVDAFDVTALAEQLASVGAKYYVITIGQNTGYFCAPNAVYDQLVGIQPSKCSKRDLVADLYPALQRKGIALMVYLPSGAPDTDMAAVKALQWKNNPQPSDPDPSLKAFQQKWESIVREWSVRWGSKVSGWWFDGCYYADAMYRGAQPPNFASLAAAARAGNPNSAVAFNPGVKDPIVAHCADEDYTAGEIDKPLALTCPGRWVRQAQFHMLSYLGKWWGDAANPPRFTTEQVVSMSTGLLEKGGVVTWDVPVTTQGAIPAPFLDQLKAVGAVAAKLKR